VFREPRLRTLRWSAPLTAPAFAVCSEVTFSETYVILARTYD
jgi:hypothetical protein